METCPRSPQPPGAPRWVAMFYDPSTAVWGVGAESPYREPVLYALGDMAQTVRARGEELRVALWGPKDGAWGEFDTAAPSASAGPAPHRPVEGGRGTTKLDERMSDRRQQVLMAGLSKAGLYDLSPDDVAVVRTLVDQLDETTVRTVAGWLAAAGAER